MSYKNIFGILIILSAIVFLILTKGPSDYEINKKICEEYFQRELKGVIIKAYIDKSNKYFFTYLVKNGKDTIKRVNGDSNIIPDLPQILEVGDSIYKPANSFKNYIFKKKENNKMIYRHGVDCVCGDSIPPDCDKKIKLLKQN